ncbi:MAG: DNA primase [Chlamydiales bacterium]
MYTKESLQQLKEKIDLIDVLSSQIDLKRVGASYKALCPFHDEKSPSFMVKRGDTHYHCFGCGAHGDAIQFLTQYLNISFREAVEMLAERFHIHLEEKDQPEQKGVHSSVLKEGLSFANQFYHFYLLHTPEGQTALHYLHERGLSTDFIRRFEVGFAPANSTLFFKAMEEKKIPKEVLFEAGLLSQDKQRPFFRERVTFPIRNPQGGVIGFSARKIREETFGGKYINTSETVLFKKSRLLFGLNYCRRRIAKERKAVLVEGQIDALQLIEAGLDLTVAALGTAFGEGHVQELKNLGVNRVYLLFDADEAGYAAASKTGDLFQKVGVEVIVGNLPPGTDPDSFVRAYGLNPLLKRMEEGRDYLKFQIAYKGREHDLQSPAGKAEVVKELTQQIKGWDDPIMVHESLRRLAQLLSVPEEMVGMRRPFGMARYARKVEETLSPVDTNRILEVDLLRLLITASQEHPHFRLTAQHYITEGHFLDPACRSLFKNYLKIENPDLLSFAGEEEAEKCLEEITRKRVHFERAEANFLETVQKMVDREWLARRESIKREMMSGNKEDREVMELAKEFDAIRRIQVEWV